VPTACNRQRDQGSDAAASTGQSDPQPSRPVKIDQITLGSGLVIEDLIVGAGDMCLPDSHVRVRYTCRVPTGEIVDSSGDGSVELHLPRMIRGWQEGLPGMRVGGKRRLTIPPHLGYGSRSVRDAEGNEAIPPDSTLVYEINLLGLVEVSAAGH
jgi:FKBP-type peptidyl-prolyl cis-trans isomerase